MTTAERRVRVGDAERDSAASALGEHFASGRLTKTEYDERLESIWAATYDADLRAQFTDLPGPHGAVGDPRPEPRVAERRRPVSRGWGVDPGARLFWLAPLMLLGLGALVFAAARGAPWLLFVAFWIFVCGGFGRGCSASSGAHGGRRHRHA